VGEVLGGGKKNQYFRLNMWGGGSTDAQALYDEKSNRKIENLKKEKETCGGLYFVEDEEQS